MLAGTLSWIGAVVALSSAVWLFVRFRYRKSSWAVDLVALIGLVTYGVVGAVVHHNAHALLTAFYFALVLEVALIFQMARADANEEVLLQIFDDNPEFERVLRRRYKKFERFGLKLPTRKARGEDTDRQ